MPELEGVELAAAVAEKVLGIENYDNPDAKYPCYILRRYEREHEEIVILRSLHDRRVWSPLRSMSDAWEILDAMVSRGWDYNVHKSWCVLTNHQSGEHRLGSGNSPGEAICRVALAVVGNGETE